MLNLKSVEELNNKVKEISLLNKDKELKSVYFQRYKFLLNELQGIKIPDENRSSVYSYVDTVKRINVLMDELNQLTEQIEYEYLLSENKKINVDYLKEKFKNKKLNKKFKNFNFNKYVELYINPKLELKNYKNEIIRYDKILVRKLLIAIHQMVFDDMDLYIINSGKEGAGKSCFSSQLMLYLYTFLKDVGLIEYDYNLKEMFFSSIEKFLDNQLDIGIEDYFRIITLDEAYDLNRGNYYEQTSKLFKQDMRASRKLLKITLLNLPQIGELDLSITLSRTNFIFDCKMDNDLTTNSLKKGLVDMYIIPRGEKIYSYEYNREFSRNEIINAFAKTFEKKSSYYVDLPQKYKIHSFKFEDVWGFDKQEYARYIKKQNKEAREKNKDLKMSGYIQYILYDKLPPLKHWGTWDLKDPTDRKKYSALNKFLSKLKNKYIAEKEAEQKNKELFTSKPTSFWD